MSLATDSRPRPAQWAARRPHLPERPGQRLTILVAGAPGAGKRTFREADPDLRLTVRNLTGAAMDGPGPTSEPIQLDLATVSDATAIYACERAHDPIVGAVVVVDTARLAGCFAIVDSLEALGMPFVIAINPLPGRDHHHPEAVRAALSVSADVPVLTCDCRDRSAVHRALVSLTRESIRVATRAS